MATKYAFTSYLRTSPFHHVENFRIFCNETFLHDMSKGAHNKTENQGQSIRSKWVEK